MAPLDASIFPSSGTARGPEPFPSRSDYARRDPGKLMKQDELKDIEIGRAHV